MAYALYTNGIQHLPLPSGEYSVGITDVHTQGDKTLVFRLFYPVDPKNAVTDPDQWVSWHLGKPYVEGVASFISPKAPWPLSQYLEYLFKPVKIPAGWQTEPADGVYPVIIVSHGLGSHRSFQSNLCCELASHGFIVASIEHSDGSACATLRIIDSDTVQFPFIGYRDGQLEKRLKEVMYTVDVLRDMNNGKLFNAFSNNSSDLKNFQNKLDLSNIILTGHSYGGATALAALAKEDNPFKACVVLDPWMYPFRDTLDSISSDLIKPVLIISTERFNQGANKKALHRFVQSSESENIRSLTMKHTNHWHNNDIPWISGWMMWWVLGGTYKVPIDTINNLQNKLFITFVNKHLGLNTKYNMEYETFLSNHKELIFEGT